MVAVFHGWHSDCNSYYMLLAYLMQPINFFYVEIASPSLISSYHHRAPAVYENFMAYRLRFYKPHPSYPIVYWTLDI